MTINDDDDVDCTGSPTPTPSSSCSCSSSCGHYFVEDSKLLTFDDLGKLYAFAADLSKLMSTKCFYVEIDDMTVEILQSEYDKLIDVPGFKEFILEHFI